MGVWENSLGYREEIRGKCLYPIISHSVLLFFFLRSILLLIRWGHLQSIPPFVSRLVAPKIGRGRYLGISQEKVVLWGFVKNIYFSGQGFFFNLVKKPHSILWLVYLKYIFIFWDLKSVFSNQFLIINNLIHVLVLLV